MLGIAGAYLLRAISESGAAPPSLIIALALAYAGSWLFWATRLRVPTRFASTTYAVTAAVILAPMLAEVTVRFHMVPDAIAASLLVGFMLAAAMLAWRRNLLAVAWVGVATGVLTSLLLILLTRDLIPYLVVLLVAALLSEVAAARQRWRSLRGLVAPAVAAAMWTLIYVFSLPASARVDYVAVPTALALLLPSLLFLLYGLSIAHRTVWARQRITIFEVVQTTVGFTLAGASWFWFGHATGAMYFGIACWLLAGASYVAAFASFNREALRNYHVYAGWSAALVLLGCFFSLPSTLAAISLSVIAIATTWVGVRLQRLIPGYQSFAYQAAAMFLFGLAQWVVMCMAGKLPRGSGWPAGWVAVCVLLCFSIANRYRGETWNARLLRTLMALLAVSIVAAFLVWGLATLTMVVTLPNASHVAVERTLVVCVLGLVLAFAGGRWHRMDLGWVAYCALAFVTVKLLFEDLRVGHSSSIAVSIFLYAVALMAVPRLGRSARQSAAVDSSARVPEERESLVR